MTWLSKLLVNGGREPCEFTQSPKSNPRFIRNDVVTIGIEKHSNHTGSQSNVSVQDEDCDLQPGDESIPKDSLGTSFRDLGNN
ncbi:UNVERIFIED_CONTAM: hypothetical protein Sangu_2513900 [Sesamum angustifolium]|uniref:Uncharacterized protein n=1 Tax=Sesamum angustifolium TaxID=2727405 RepID=A0AAW2JKW3_9LAMI